MRRGDRRRVGQRVHRRGHDLAAADPVGGARAGALGGLARAIGPALAEMEATGLVRAAQTGVKALGRQMEARAGASAAARSTSPFLPKKVGRWR